MTVGVGLEGDQGLVARLAHARAGILDLSDANRDIAQAVDHTATPPRATGVLAASSVVTVAADSWGITSRASYAVRVHWGTRYMRARPWLTEAAQDTDQLGMLADHLQQLLD